MRGSLILCIFFMLSSPLKLVAQAAELAPLLSARILEGSNPPVEMVLARADLDALPQISFETTTLWTSGVVAFSGPALSALVELLVGPERTGTVLLRARNGYFVEIPLQEIHEVYPIVASRSDGAPFGLREKGPLWVVFPFDMNPDYQSETSLAHSIWQLNEIEVFIR